MGAFPVVRKIIGRAGRRRNPPRRRVLAGWRIALRCRLRRHRPAHQSPTSAHTAEIGRRAAAQKSHDGPNRSTLTGFGGCRACAEAITVAPARYGNCRPRRGALKLPHMGHKS